ncbi:hypothetical protein NRB20_19840 [Nocardia sp. RB20]|uniref:Uncharacterized protein n=1 Tax=Nocardia macrotermitis TaxID=2585198 RepID=A0A7K0CZN6_9NOCA|nr:hypothetical protein [Nocardia macrotermitis]
MGSENLSAAATYATDVTVAEYDSIQLPEIGWIGIQQFRRDPQGAFSVSGLDAEGRWVENIPLPHGVRFRVR